MLLRVSRWGRDSVLNSLTEKTDDRDTISDLCLRNITVTATASWSGV